MILFHSHSLHPPISTAHTLLHGGLPLTGPTSQWNVVSPHVVRSGLQPLVTRKPPVCTDPKIFNAEPTTAMDRTLNPMPRHTDSSKLPNSAGSP